MPGDARPDARSSRGVVVVRDLATAEIIAVGSELLTPFRIDTDSLFLTRRLNDVGITVVAKSIVGDDRPALAAIFRAALDRADVVLTTGGLGPTEDDVTREVIADALAGAGSVASRDQARPTSMVGIAAAISRDSSLSPSSASTSTPAAAPAAAKRTWPRRSPTNRSPNWLRASLMRHRTHSVASCARSSGIGSAWRSTSCCRSQRIA